MPDKKEVYRWVRIGGLITLVPVSLCVGPLAGYFAGEWLIEKLLFPQWSLAACILAGLLGSILETIHIIRSAIRYLGLG